MYKQEFVGPILQLIQEHCPDVSPLHSTTASSSMGVVRQLSFSILLTLVGMKECLP